MGVWFRSSFSVRGHSCRCAIYCCCLGGRDGGWRGDGELGGTRHLYAESRFRHIVTTTSVLLSLLGVVERCFRPSFALLRYLVFELAIGVVLE